MTECKIPKTNRAAGYNTRVARREADALGLVVEVLEICDCDAERARVLHHACALLGIRVSEISDAGMKA